MPNIYDVQVEVMGSTISMFFDAFPSREHILNVINSYESERLVTEGLKTLEGIPKDNWFDPNKSNMQQINVVGSSYRNITLNSFYCHHISSINPDEPIRNYGKEYLEELDTTFNINKIKDWHYLNSHSSYLRNLDLSVPTNNEQYDVSPITQLFIASRGSAAVSLTEIESEQLVSEVHTFIFMLDDTRFAHVQEILDICLGYKFVTKEQWDAFIPTSTLTKDRIKYDYFNWKD